MLYSTPFPKKIKLSIVPTLFLTTFNSSLKGYERLSGFEGDFFTIIAKHLGFEYDVVIPEDMQWGRKKNDGNWTGMIGVLARREADMAVGLISMDANRSKVVDFSAAYTMQEENFVIEKAHHDQTPLFAFLYTFDVSVWLCLILTILIAAIVFYKLSLYKTNYLDIVLKLVASLVKQPFKVNFNCNIQQFLFVIWLFFALVVSVGYSAKLLAFLTVPLRKQQIRNFLELFRSVKRGTHKCLAYKDSYILQFLRDSNNAYLKHLRNIIFRNEWYVNSTPNHRSLVNQYTGIIISEVQFELFYTAPGYQSRYTVVEIDL